MEPNDKPSLLPIPHISRDAALYSEYVRQMLEDVDEEKKDERIVIPVKTVRGEVLSMVAAFCEFQHRCVVSAGEDGRQKDEAAARAWEAEFVKVDQSTLFELVLASNYLNGEHRRAAHIVRCPSSPLLPSPCQSTAHPPFRPVLSRPPVKPLLDLCCMTVANLIKGKTPEEIRRTFGIKNDFTPEEEEEVKRENQWAFE